MPCEAPLQRHTQVLQATSAQSAPPPRGILANSHLCLHMFLCRYAWGGGHCYAEELGILALLLYMGSITRRDWGNSGNCAQQTCVSLGSGGAAALFTISVEHLSQPPPVGISALLHAGILFGGKEPFTTGLCKQLWKLFEYQYMFSIFCQGRGSSGHSGSPQSEDHPSGAVELLIPHLL